MNRIRRCMVMMCLLAIFTTMANPITESQARTIASRFMAGKAMPSATLRMAHRGPSLNAQATTADAAYYVFNNSGNGYVIVAGDDRAPAVLGYSDKGSFDAGMVPEAMQELLDSYAEQITALNQGYKTERLMASRPAISPLLTGTWSQNNPYNILLPIVNGKHAVAGCVATAMAQIMYYHKWPARPTTAIPAYTTSSLSLYMPELPVVDFEWNLMQDMYQTDDTTSAEALAAARLTLYCAQSVEMDYKVNTSGATSTRIPMMLTNYFDYKPSTHSISRANYTSQEWADLLYSELAAGRPLIYSGSKKTGGHAFICDGYDGNGMYHINWGWNGQSNGYFLLNVLNPDVQGTGSASGTYGYILSQAAIVGIEPGHEGSSTFEVTATNVALNSYSTSRSSTSSNFTAVVTSRYCNYTSQVMAVSIGWGLYQGETLKSVLYETYSSSVRPGFHLNLNSKTVNFGKDITSGTYRIVPIYSELNAGNWRPCIGTDKNYIEVTIADNTCTYKGYGTLADRDYTVNDITFDGKMHNGRPIDIAVNMTNNGESHGELLSMFADGAFVSAGYVGLEPGETGDIPFKYMPETAGDKVLTWSWNDDGSDPIASRTVTITAMPEASLSATVSILNVTNASSKIITDNKFSVVLTITNNGTTTYDEDISVKLFKQTHGTSGNNVQGKNQAIVLPPGQTTTLQFDMDNVSDGWKYFIKSYYYSSGEQISLKGTSTYTIIFPDEPEVILGDVDNDGTVGINDVTMLIDYLLGGSGDINTQAADIDADNSISINDVTNLIDMLLRS